MAIHTNLFIFTKKISLTRVFVITLLSIYLFNLSGYFIYYKYFIYRSDKQAIIALDNRLYNESELMEIKIPLNLPYLTSQTEYERVDGELQYQGVYYNYVERKISNDTLFLKCRQNNLKTSLYRSLNEYTKKANDIPSEDKGGSSVKKPSFAYEYVQHFASYAICSPVEPGTTYAIAPFASIYSPYINDAFKPPRFLVVS